MPRGIKKQGGLDTDFTITDAAKRMKTRKAQLEEASGYSSPNETDLLNEELEQQNEPESVRNIFEN